MIRDVILYPDRCLETRCEPVTEFDTPGLHQLVADLFETMYFHEGVGLAAPQIRVMKQVAVIDPSSGRDPEKKIVLVNPQITEAQGTQCSEEGCLSFPDFVERITRSDEGGCGCRGFSGRIGPFGKRRPFVPRAPARSGSSEWDSVHPSHELAETRIDPPQDSENAACRRLGSGSKVRVIAFCIFFSCLEASQRCAAKTANIRLGTWGS